MRTTAVHVSNEEGSHRCSTFFSLSLRKEGHLCIWTKEDSSRTSTKFQRHTHTHPPSHNNNDDDDDNYRTVLRPPTVKCYHQATKYFLLSWLCLGKNLNRFKNSRRRAYSSYYYVRIEPTAVQYYFWRYCNKRSGTIRHPLLAEISTKSDVGANLTAV
jgi:hypothetical protein